MFLAITAIWYTCSLTINAITFRGFVSKHGNSLCICRHTVLIHFPESAMLFKHCSEHRRSYIHSASQNHSAFTHSLLALVSAPFLFQDLQSRFPILLRHQTRLIYAVHVIRKKNRESLVISLDITHQAVCCQILSRHSTNSS